MRKILLCCVGLALAVTGVQAQSLIPYSGAYDNPGPPPGVPGPNSITQNLDTMTVSPGSVHCGVTGTPFHVDNSYIRRFFLNADHGIVNSFDVQSLDWAIEAATGANGSQPVDINLYSIPSGAALTFANLTPIGSTSLSVSDAALAGISTNVSGTISDPTTTDLVVEVFTPDGSTAGHSFFIGSNGNGQTQPSYIAAAGCGITEPTDLANIGFPNMHVIMVVNGIEAGGVPTMQIWALVLLAVLMLGISLLVLRRRSQSAV